MGLSNRLWLGLPVAKGMILRPFGNGEMLNMANDCSTNKIKVSM